MGDGGGTAAGRAAEVADRKFWSCCVVAIGVDRAKWARWLRP